MTDPSARSGDIDGLGVMIAESATKLFQRFGALNNAAVRQRQNNEVAVDDVAWAEVEEAGFPLAMLDEDAGGVGAVHAFNIIQLAAQYAFISPLPETMGANWVLWRAGRAPAKGAATFSETVFDLKWTGAAWGLSGAATAVPWARCGDLIAFGRYEDRLYVLQLESGHARSSLGVSVSGEPQDTLLFDMHIAPACVCVAPEGLDPFEVRKFGAALRTAQLAGAMAGIIGMTVQHARDRKQFGRPLGGFQAVQQLLATMATQSAAANVAAEIAAEAAGGGLSLLAVAAAKIRAGEAAGVVAAGAHQIHGAIGFTKEHSLQLLTRRLWAWRDDFGGEAAWSILLGKALATPNQPALWPLLTAV